MNDYLTEQEQVELLKKWIKQYSLVILMGVVLAAASITGWRYWQQRHNEALMNASSIYDQMLTMRVQNNVADAMLVEKQLLSTYSKTVYAQMAAFTEARYAVLKGNYALAEDKLNWIIKHSAIPALRQIARIRLARVLIGAKQPDKAIGVLNHVDDKTFGGMTNEVIGDAYFVMQNYVAAREAYGAALASLPNAEVVQPILQMKFDNLTSKTNLSHSTSL